MTEEQGPYDLDRDEHDDTDGLERIGDVLHRLIDERGWPLTLRLTRANAGADDDPLHGDA